MNDLQPPGMLLSPPSPVKRKYLAEAGLNLFSEGPVLFRPSDIYVYGKHDGVRRLLQGTNIYLICRRRRISVDPHSLKVKSGDIHGEFLVHSDSLCSWERERFVLRSPLRDSAHLPIHFLHVWADDERGHQFAARDAVGRRFNITSTFAIAYGSHKLSDRTRLEVMYVGKAFGSAGERLAVDRLSRHSTLQRIMAETMDHSGQDELLILGLRYGHSKNILSSAGFRWVEPSATASEEGAHLVKAGGQQFSRQDRVLLAEAALINYFKPRYNVQHLDSFSYKERRRQLTTLRSLLALLNFKWVAGHED